MCGIRASIISVFVGFVCKRPVAKGRRKRQHLNREFRSVFQFEGVGSFVQEQNPCCFTSIGSRHGLYGKIMVFRVFGIFFVVTALNFRSSSRLWLSAMMSLSSASMRPSILRAFWKDGKPSTCVRSPQ